MPHRPRARGAVALPRRLRRLRAADDRRRLAGRVAVARGTTSPKAEPEGEDVAALLDAAEDIVNSAAPDILSEFDEEAAPVRQAQEAQVAVTPACPHAARSRRRNICVSSPSNTWYSTRSTPSSSATLTTSARPGASGSGLWIRVTRWPGVLAPGAFPGLTERIQVGAEPAALDRLAHRDPAVAPARDPVEVALTGRAAEQDRWARALQGLRPHATRRQRHEPAFERCHVVCPHFADHEYPFLDHLRPQLGRPAGAGAGDGMRELERVVLADQRHSRPISRDVVAATNDSAMYGSQKRA